jgi:hypothetical protein
MRRPHSPSREDVSPFVAPPDGDPGPAAPPNEAERRAGFILACEFEQVIQPGSRYFIEEAGKTADGRRLWSVYVQRLALKPGDPS